VQAIQLQARESLPRHGARSEGKDFTSEETSNVPRFKWVAMSAFLFTVHLRLCSGMFYFRLVATVVLSFLKTLKVLSKLFDSPSFKICGLHALEAPVPPVAL
jgi:hypothetical protein